jgi:hypothetical protein
MKRSLLALLFIGLLSALVAAQSHNEVQFIVTSDSHYGVTRASFRGQTNVDAHTVNAALVAAMNRLPSAKFPADGGIRGNQSVGAVDFVVDTGDIANREEQTEDRAIQNSAASFAQFRRDYLDGLEVRNPAGRKAPLYVVPGNHDASNAVGYYKTLMPPTDATSMAEIFNLMMSPSTLLTAASFDYSRDKIRASHDYSGLHFVFLTLWPDSETRSWMEHDLSMAGAATPTIVFAHDPPDSDPKHFKNPSSTRGINATDKFENLLPDVFTENRSDQAALETFLKHHPNVTAYFHGHNNWTQFYDWTGPGHSVTLHTFRVDSPMKGHFSAMDETKMSFEIATIDTVSRTMTVREVLWNGDPKHPDAPAMWGASTTVALAPRPNP